MIYVSPQQSIFEVPNETAVGTGSVVAISNGASSAPAQITVQQAAPSILTQIAADGDKGLFQLGTNAAVNITNNLLTLQIIAPVDAKTIKHGTAEMHGFIGQNSEFAVAEPVERFTNPGIKRGAIEHVSTIVR